MEPRRSFLNVLRALWPFGQASAGSQASAEVEPQTPPTPPPSLDTVVNQALKDCIDAMKDEAQRGDNLTFDEASQPFEKLKKYCGPAFEQCLGLSQDGTRWGRDKAKVLEMARLVVRSARLVRAARGDKKRKIIFAYDIRGGLELVSKACKIDCPQIDPSGPQKPFRAYCVGAVNPDDRDENPNNGWGREDRPEDEA